MSELITTGTWTVDDAKAAQFVDAWASFAAWASGQDGAGTLRLGRDRDDARRFVSFGPWSSPEATHVWKANEEFRPRMAEVLQHVEDFHPLELDLVASADNGRSTVVRMTDNA